jgi:progressive ankylosis protein
VIKTNRSTRSILLLWLPLALQWLMMSFEGPFLAAIIARLADPTFNLAAYGVAFALAILVESPVIMLMSATTALLDGAESYRRLRNFAVGLSVFSTGLLALVLIPPLYSVLMRGAFGLPEEVSELVYGSLWLLLPWPGAIGLRRFLHGVLIRAGRTRLIAYGTVVRLCAMAGTALLLGLFDIRGAWVGAGALSAGVVVEAVVAWFMARSSVGELLGRAESMPSAAVGDHVTTVGAAMGAGAVRAVEKAGPAPLSVRPLDYAMITRFYYPLALTSFIALSAQPLLTFFMGRAPMPLESLALFPVLHALTFLFTALGLSYQEAAIALIGRRCEHVRELARFAMGLAAFASGAFAVVVYTPLAAFWFETLTGLPPGLAEIARTAAGMLVLLPALSVLLALQRAILVQLRTTGWITMATVAEVLAIAIFFPVMAWGFGLIGIIATAGAVLGGRLIGALFLLWRTGSTLRLAGQ